ncbi:MAG: apolipoprotein N-acyltransferase, partial [Flavobacteriaceae bacterium]
FYWAKGRLPLKGAYLFLIVLWLAFEKLHLSWDFSWSWLNLGNVFSDKIYWIQWYEYTGTFGGSLWVLAINIWSYMKLKVVPLNAGGSQFVKKMVSPLLAIALPIAFSLLIYKTVEEVEPTLNIILHQPNIDPYSSKYNLTNTTFLSQFKEEVFPYLSADTDYVLSPETYFAEGYGEQLNGLENTVLFQKIQRELLAYPKLQWITGIQLYKLYEQENLPSLTANKVKTGLWVDYYNSALSIQSRKGAQLYHKSKLVVGIENMPFKSLLKPLLGDLLIDLGGTVASRAVQEERSVFSNPISKSKTGPIICWESVFGEFVTGYIKNGAQFLTVITNDAWWGNTPGHKQLKSYTQLRAIETRRAIARSANTGISAFINARGEVIKQTAYNTQTVLQGKIAPRTEITFYVRYGDIIARWAGFLTVLFLLLALSGRFKNKITL